MMKTTIVEEPVRERFPVESLTVHQLIIQLLEFPMNSLVLIEGAEDEEDHAEISDVEYFRKEDFDPAPVVLRRL